MGHGTEHGGLGHGEAFWQETLPGLPDVVALARSWDSWNSWDGIGRPATHCRTCNILQIKDTKLSSAEMKWTSHDIPKSFARGRWNGSASPLRVLRPKVNWQSRPRRSYMGSRRGLSGTAQPSQRSSRAGPKRAWVTSRATARRSHPRKYRIRLGFYLWVRWVSNI